MINNGGTDEGEFLLTTALNNSSMDDNNGDEFEVFDVGTVAQLYSTSTGTGEPNIEVGSEPGLTAVAPDGTAILFQNETIGFNIAGHPGQCYFAGLIQKVG